MGDSIEEYKAHHVICTPSRKPPKLQCDSSSAITATEALALIGEIGTRLPPGYYLRVEILNQNPERWTTEVLAVVRKPQEPPPPARESPTAENENSQTEQLRAKLSPFGVTVL